MPSSYTASGRFTLQATGENLNVWGQILNNGVFQLVDDSVAGINSFTLSGGKTLTTANGASDEARKAILNITGGTGGTITIPSVSKTYFVRNASTGNVVITTGGTTNATIPAGDTGVVFSDGTAVWAQRIAGYYLKDYIDQAVLAATGSLPASAGNNGKVLYCNGVTWLPQFLQVTDVTGAAPTASPSFTGGATLSGSVKQNASAMAALDIDVSAAEFFTKSISTSSTFTFSNLTSGKAQAWVLRLTISAGAVPTWPASVKWSGGNAPSFGNGTHDIGFITFDGATVDAVPIATALA